MALVIPNSWDFNEKVGGVDLTANFTAIENWAATVDTARISRFVIPITRRDIINGGTEMTLHESQAQAGYTFTVEGWTAYARAMSGGSVVLSLSVEGVLKQNLTIAAANTMYSGAVNQEVTGSPARTLRVWVAAGSTHTGVVDLTVALYCKQTTSTS